MTPDTIAAFAEARIPPDARAAVERHLATCPDCRRDVAHIVRLRRRPVARFAFPAAGVAAAAAIVFLVSRPERPGPDPVPALRDGAESALAVSVISPDSISDPATPFAWRSVAGGSRYTFTLTSESGTRLFSTSTGDTAVTLPPGIRLDPGQTYLWFVDAMREDGRSATSGIRVVRVLPR